jgi:hypothetical protein
MPEERVAVIVRTMDRSRAAEVTLPRETTVMDLVQASKDNWKLAGDVEYQIINNRTGMQLLPTQLLSPEVVADGDELVVNPLLVAG